MPVEYLTHKGKRIFYADYRRLKTLEELIQNLELEVQFFRDSPHKILMLVD